MDFKPYNQAIWEAEIGKMKVQAKSLWEPLILTND
jgi:hypothetical protein